MRVIIQKNLKNWEKYCLPHVEFTYNRSIHSTISYSPFEVMYGFNPLTPLDILPLPSNDYVSFDGKKKADSIKELHSKVRATIEKKNKQYAKQANKGHIKVIFELGDWVWVHDEILPPRASDRRLQKDWARDAREGPRVLMSLRVDFGSMGYVCACLSLYI